jgi:hypothetical protein
LPIALVVLQPDYFFRVKNNRISIGSRRIDRVYRSMTERYIPLTREYVGANIDREVWVRTTIFNRIVVGVLISAVGCVYPTNPHEVLLLIKRHLVNQLQIWVENLIGVQIAVLKGYVPRQTSVHILHDHEIADVRRRVADNRIIGSQCSW